MMKHAVLPGLVMLLLFIGAGGQSAAQLSTGSGGSSTPSTMIGNWELPPEDCFDVYLGNQSFCKNLYCSYRWFAWFEWVRCEEEPLMDCLADAEALFNECLEGQGS